MVFILVQDKKKKIVKQKPVLEKNQFCLWCISIFLLNIYIIHFYAPYDFRTLFELFIGKEIFISFFKLLSIKNNVPYKLLLVEILKKDYILTKFIEITKIDNLEIHKKMSFVDIPMI